jgi:hypothetical protein
MVPSVARADEVATCVKASEAAQSLRDEGKYKRAREQLLVCTRDACPSVVRKDCAGWLSEIDASMPSVVVSARDASGKDLVDVKVTLDGQPLTDKLDGKPVTIDPGKHALRYEATGSPAVEEEIVMHAGEKNRALNVRLGAPAGPAPSPASPSEASPRADTGGRVPPAVAFVLGGIGLVAIGSFAYFGLTGKNDVSDLRSTCAPACDQDKVDKARAKLIIADISLGVGIVALGVATYLLIANRPAASATVTTAIDVKAVPGGGVAQLGGRF